MMEYIGSLCHYPDSKTKILIVLYSIGKQIGKSIPLRRGSRQLRHKKLRWFEEIAGDKCSFRNRLERMKSTITDSVQYIYHEEVQAILLNLLVLQNLIGIVEDKIFDVNLAEQHNKDIVTTILLFSTIKGGVGQPVKSLTSDRNFVRRSRSCTSVSQPSDTKKKIEPILLDSSFPLTLTQSKASSLHATNATWISHATCLITFRIS
ncbi:hypothetical protein Plhal304r1_c019g0068021 [Plasmopara halstedii]